jgi:hypothetical protein
MISSSGAAPLIRTQTQKELPSWVTHFGEYHPQLLKEIDYQLEVPILKLQILIRQPFCIAGPIKNSFSFLNRCFI